MRAIPSVLTFAALTAVTVAAHADGLRTDERPIDPPSMTTTTAPMPRHSGVSNPAMTPDRPDDTAPQTRDDGEIEYRLMVRMSAVDPLRLGDVHVRSVRGAVTLYGTVPDQASRDRALLMTNAFDGVRVVRDELDMVPRSANARGGGPVDDASLAAGVTRELAGDKGVVGQPIRVSAEHGVVTLHGSVATFADARRILSRAKTVPGVFAVRPALHVNTQRVVAIDADANARRR